MKKFRGILLITIIVPNLVFASFGNSFNNLLNKFFGTSQSQTTTEKNLNEPEISRDLPELENLTEFRREIQNEEEKLAQIEEKLAQSQNDLAATIREKNMAQFQLDFLDNDINLAQQKLAELQKLKQNWETKLVNLTKDKEYLRAANRVFSRSLNNFLSKNFIQEESLQANSDISIFRWLFSRKTVSQILETRLRKREFIAEQKNKINQLKKLQQRLKKEEQRTAEAYQRIKNLTDQTNEQKKLLVKLADAKAQILAKKELTQAELEAEIAQNRVDQAESTIFLQNLRIGMSEFSEFPENPTETEISETKTSKPLTFPLKIPRKITANFMDADYKKVMGRDHFGTDFRAPQGTEIFAPADGTIKKVVQNGYRYAYLIIDHGDDFYTVYGHLSEIFVKDGQAVKTGEKIALSGGTPGMIGSGYFTTGPHLHFEVFKDGKHVNPLDYLAE